MPFESEKQRRLMYAAAGSPEVAKKTGVPQSVAKEFIEKDSSGIPEFLNAVSRGDAQMISACSNNLKRPV